MIDAASSDPAHRDGLERNSASPTAAPHPEEIMGTVTATFGNWATFTATGRTTPAGVISVAILSCAVLLPLLILTRRR